MKIDNSKNHGGLFSRFRARMAGSMHHDQKEQEQKSDSEESQLMKDFDAVKKNPGQLTGWDFDRAFEFIEHHSDTDQAEILLGQMHSTKGQALKGLSYASAVKILQRMPGHAGTESIIKGMRLLEEDYIQEIRSDVIAYIIEIIPDHPLVEKLVVALASKNLTNAYDFVINNPDNSHAKGLIKAMFDRDPNVAVLLLQEKMDHPQVSSIIEGIYNITRRSDIKKLTPNAIIFILDVSPDHPNVEEMIEVLVQENYVKAYEFIKQYPDHSLVEVMKKKVLARKPELEKLFGGND